MECVFLYHHSKFIQYSCCTSYFSVYSLPWCSWSFLFNLLFIISCIHRPYIKTNGMPRGLWRSSNMNVEQGCPTCGPPGCYAACGHIYKLYIYTVQSRWLAYHILWFLHATHKQVHNNGCGPLPEKSGHPSCTASHKLAQISYLFTVLNKALFLYTALYKTCIII